MKNKILILLSFSLLLISHNACAQKNTGLLWKITGKDIKQPTYVFGTVHMFDTAHYKIPSVVLSKLDEVSTLCVELDFGNMNQAELMNSIWIKDSSFYLNKVLDAATLRKYDDLSSGSMILKMLSDKRYQINPMFISTFLMFGSSVALDMELYTRAKARDAKVVGLETAKEQLDALDRIPLTAQITSFKQFINTFTTQQDMLAKLNKYYVTQDIDHMMEKMSEDMPSDPSLNEELVVKRNKIMFDRIQPLLGNDGIMIAVGAGHLGTSTGLISLFKEKGYKVIKVGFEFEKK